MQADLAQRIGVHVQSIGNWERGVHPPTIRQLPKVIEFLGYDPVSIPDTLPDQISHARRVLGLTQEELARALAVDLSSVLRWEAGDTPSSLNLTRLQALIGERFTLANPNGHHLRAPALNSLR